MTKLKVPDRVTDDGVVWKICSRCLEWNPKTEAFFHFRKKRGTWENPCRQCGRDYMREYVLRNPQDTYKIWTYQIKSRYGITEQQYYQMLANQDGVCAVCRTPPTPEKKLSVDYCHETGRVRGLLCYKCNTAAGLLGDNPALAAQLTLYLEGDSHA